MELFIVISAFNYDYGGTTLGVFNNHYNARKAVIKDKLSERKRYTDSFKGEYYKYIDKYWMIYKTTLNTLIYDPWNESENCEIINY